MKSWGPTFYLNILFYYLHHFMIYCCLNKYNGRSYCRLLLTYFLVSEIGTYCSNNY